MIWRALLAAGVAVFVGRRMRRARALREATATAVPAEAARGLVERALAGGRAQRRQLALNLAPARATAVELLVDGPSFFPRLIADIEAATTDVHILIFGFKDGEIGGRIRDLLVAEGRRGRAGPPPGRGGVQPARASGRRRSTGP